MFRIQFWKRIHISGSCWASLKSKNFECFQTLPISIYNPWFNGSTPPPVLSVYTTPPVLSVYTSLNISNRIAIRPGIPSYISGYSGNKINTYRSENTGQLQHAGLSTKIRPKFLKSKGWNWPSQKWALKILKSKGWIWPSQKSALKTFEI